MKSKFLFLISFFLVAISASATNGPKPMQGSSEYSLLLGLGRYYLDSEYAKGVDYAYDLFMSIHSECLPIKVPSYTPGKGVDDDDLSNERPDDEDLHYYTGACANNFLNSYHELRALFKSYSNTSYNQGLVDGLDAAYVDKAQNKLSKRVTIM